MKRRKLPIGGVQTFEKLRNQYDVYVDKTAQIYEIASRYGAVFLARPRRFGKSLLCSTIESLFRGERGLFEGLAIADTDWEWKPHPIIHLEFAGEDYTENGLDKLNGAITRQLDKACDEYGISVQGGGSLSDKFARVITELSKKVGQVVVVIDEYDNPLLNTFDQPDVNTRMREKLKGFYSVLKQSDRYLRFAFVTGVTKFAQISMFSGFNQPKDISMASEYCDICGITQWELEHYFEPEISAFAPKHGGRDAYLARLKMFYDGYCFTREMVPVYNIYGILNHFDASAEFSPFWSMSGQPSFARKYLEARDVDIAELEGAEMQAVDFGDYKDNTITLFPLLYQAGYLTISDYDERIGYYRLSYPNVEVRQSLAAFLARNYLKADDTVRKSASAKLVKSLLDGGADSFMETLRLFLGKVDYSLSSRITEYYFEFAVSNIINLLGLKCENEVRTATGRMDSVIHAGDYIYVLEFKVDKGIGEAMSQLEDRDYAALFRDSGKQVVEIGVVFSRDERNIVEWEVRR